MQHSFKSPLKPTAKSIPPRSYTPKPKSKPAVMSAAKPQQHIKREVFNNQIYKNILSRMLSKNTIEQFLEETSKFIILNDEVLRPYQKHYYYSKNTQDFPELGRAMLRDGSFIRHFCKLMILKEPHRDEELKRYFYQRYKEDICEKKSYFETFFKVEIKQESNYLSQSQRKISSKPDVAENSIKTSKSSKKSILRSITKSKYCGGRGQPQEQVSYPGQILQVQCYSCQQTEVVEASQNDLPKKTQQQASTICLQGLEQESHSVQRFTHRSRNKHKDQTEEERERRLLGLVQKSSAKSITPIMSAKCPIRFVDQMESNKRLKQIYQSLKKQRQEIEQKLQSQKRDKRAYDDNTPIKRQTYRILGKSLKNTRISQLTPDILSKMSDDERKLLQYFPKVDRFGIVSAVVKDSPIIVGIFEQRVVKKCFVTDLMQYLEPTYIAVYFEQECHKLKDKNIQDFDQLLDQTVEVVLIKEAPL